MAASSSTEATRRIDTVSWLALRTARKDRDRNCDPLSEWTTIVPSGDRWAEVARSAVIWLESIHDCRAVELAFRRWILGDVAQPDPWVSIG